MWPWVLGVYFGCVKGGGDKLGFGGGVGVAFVWSEVGAEYSTQEKSAAKFVYGFGGKDKKNMGKKIKKKT